MMLHISYTDPLVILIVSSFFNYINAQQDYATVVAYEYGLTAKNIEYQDSLIALYQKYQAGKLSLDDVSESVRSELETIESFGPNLYTLLPGCSWYCGANYRVECSSSLSPNRGYSYECTNLSNFSLRDAWIEGDPEYGIGQKILFTFPPEHPRITGLWIANGYVKDEKTYYSNSRASKLLMRKNGEVYATIKILDRHAMQKVEFDDIVFMSKTDYTTIEFEILEVYEGRKYKDTAITQLFFDGIDVH